MFKLAKTVLKNLFSSPPTRKYPYVVREPFKRYRGHIDINIDDCIFCGICQKSCPVSAINVTKEQKSWEIDPFKCIACEYCSEKCPKKCLRVEEDYSKASMLKSTYKAEQKDKN